jgi:hypothetical protein
MNGVPPIATSTITIFNIRSTSTPAVYRGAVTRFEKGAAMDVSNPDIWKQQWTAFMSAPYVVAPLVVFAGLVGWWLKGITIAGLKGRISVFEDRLKLAAKQAESARQAKDEVATEFGTYMAEVAAKAENAALGASAARVEGAIVRFAAANNSLSEILGVTEDADSGQSERANGRERKDRVGLLARPKVAAHAAPELPSPEARRDLEH